MIARYAYDDNGNRISLEYPESGLTTAYTYNSANLVTSLVNRRGYTVVSSYRYTYYLDGNQKSKTGADGKVTDYVYDGMGRLARESEAEGNTIVYAYDRFSNRSSMTVTGGETYTTTYGYHPNNWLLTEEKREKDTVETYRYRYDGNGNQVYREWSRTGPDDGTVPRVGYVPNGFRRELATLEIRGYNGFNQTASLYADGERTAYTYRPDGLRYGKTYGSGADATGVTHLWDGQNIVAEVGATGVIVARYLRGANLIAREQDGALQYYLHNAHGDVVQRTDALGNLLKNYRYDAFGNEEHPEPLDVNPFRYCGEYFDRETGDYYLRARSYGPRTGRFTAEDPIRSETNWYFYCGNNPTAFHDPTGNYSVVGPNTRTYYDRSGNSHEVTSGTGYRLVQHSDILLYSMGVPSQFFGPLGRIAWNEPMGTVGGSSHGLQSALNIQENALWKSANDASDVYSIFSILDMEIGAVSVAGQGLSLVNTLDLLFTQGDVAAKDTTLFALIDFYGLPTTFDTVADAEAQMEMLTDIYEGNRSYFTGGGGIFEGSQFQKDLRYHRIKDPNTRGMRLMEDELGMSTWDVMQAKSKNKYVGAQYLRRSQYSKRIERLWMDLYRHSR